jgi:uncharacterized protein YkwD
MDYGKGLMAAVASLCFLLFTDPALSAPPAADALYSEQSWKTFAQLSQARAPIVFERVDLNLLSAAIFHETNRQRANQKLSPLAFDSAARRAANLQAQIMAKTGDVSHENPGHPQYETLSKRLTSVGLAPRFAAENLAYTFAVQYRSGDRVYVREENGHKIFSHKPDGPPLASHTYISFAKSVVDQWMNSPGHRQNLLHREPTFLGVGCRPATGESGLPMIYCCQVFYAPLQARN